MRIRSTFKALLTLALSASVFTACGDDCTAPGDAPDPVTLNPTIVANKPPARAFVREGNTWREITSENPDILSRESIVNASVIDTTSDVSFTLTSSTRWETAASPGATFTYSYAGNKFMFTGPFGVNSYATGDYTKLNMHMIAGLTVHEDGFATTIYSERAGYDPSIDAIDALTSGSRALPFEEGTVLAYQTFDIIYEAE